MIHWCIYLDVMAQWFSHRKNTNISLDNIKAVYPRSLIQLLFLFCFFFFKSLTTSSTVIQSVIKIWLFACSVYDNVARLLFGNNRCSFFHYSVKLQTILMSEWISRFHFPWQMRWQFRAEPIIYQSVKRKWSFQEVIGLHYLISALRLLSNSFSWSNYLV